MKLADVITVIESEFPLLYQESYDNSGLLVGDANMNISAALLCIDVTESVIDEAVQIGANLIISHHPVLFHALKRVTNNTFTERIIIASVRNNIAIYSAHTNADNVMEGVNHRICSKLGLVNLKILSPNSGTLRKLITYVPADKADEVRTALFDAGAGGIGKYDSCSFNLQGSGSFRASEGTKPFAGKIGELHFENETRIETIFPLHLKEKIMKALRMAHPYEEVAFDMYTLDIDDEKSGSGMIGELEVPCDEKVFLNLIKSSFHCRFLRHSKLIGKPLKRVAVCGGSGSFLIHKAISAKAELFVTADVKYHQFFDAEDKLVIADIGHYESEQFTIEIFYEILTKKIPNFAIHFSRISTSPIYYF
jgi:dinuclear metal center YbgI/SA1388 family protein